jgi:hypothetical protein
VSAEVSFATLASRGRSVCLVRVEGGNHSFRLPNSDGWMQIMEEVRRWFDGEAAVAFPRSCINS